MKSVKKLLLIILICVLLNLNLAAENNSKSFLKKNLNEKITKTNSETKAEALVQTKTEMTTQTELEKPLVNNNISSDKSEEEKYEMERMNAMADFIF